MSWRDRTNEPNRIRGRASQARRARVLARDPHCYICGVRRSTVVDHVVNLASGGDAPAVEGGDMKFLANTVDTANLIGPLSLPVRLRSFSMPQTGPLERSVMRSVRASNHIAAADAATVELARALAREIDADSSRAWRYGSQFIEVLRQLRLTPKERRALPDAPPAVEPDPLAVLRERLANRGSRE